MDDTELMTTMDDVTWVLIANGYRPVAGDDVVQQETTGTVRTARFQHASGTLVTIRISTV